ncbi:MAG: adenylate/guanylate cyclase domain-containing protein [Flavobacteriales bacterium]
MWRRVVPLLLALFQWLAPSGAQQYDLRTFSLEHGLPSASVNDLCEDAEGFLWVATDQGAARGQGLRFEAIGGTQGQPASEVTALLAMPDGRMWRGARKGALSWGQNGRTVSWSGQALPTFPVRALVPDENGTLWLASRGGGIWQINTGTQQVLSVSNGLLSLRINALVRLPDERLLAATDSGLAVLEKDRWVPIRSSVLPSQRTLALYADEQGVLVGTDKGYAELDPQLRPLPISERFAGYQPLVLPHPVVLSVLRTSTGEIWLGTPAGSVHLSRRKGVPTLTTIAEANGLGHDLVRCLHQDRSGGIWIGTAFGGVSKFTSDAFQYFTERDGLGSRIVSAIHRTADGVLWMGTQGGGVARWDGNRITTFGREHGLPSMFITCLGEDARGYLLAGTAMHGLHRLKGDRFQPALEVGRLESARVNAIERGPDDRVWVGTASGLFLEKGDGSYVSMGPKDRAINDMLITADTLWAATDSGLYRTADLQWTRYGSIPITTITSLGRDTPGSIWIGTAASGLYRLSNGKVDHFEMSDGLQSLAIEGIMLDAWENVWLGTRKGVHQVELDVLQEQVLNIKQYGPDDGFIGIESLRNACMLDGDSTLWFGTVRGAIHYDPSEVVEETREPLIHLTELQLFYERPDWTPWCHGMGRNGFPQELELPHDKNHLTFAFTGISLAYPEKVRYRWILEGYDPDWSPITATQRVTYSNIPPGSYTFKVMARNASGIWNEEPITYAFTIAPPFWQTNTFRIAVGGALLLLLFGIVRVRERNLRKDRERLERTVANRTRELATEKDRSERLLLNILPASTAEELKLKGTAEARRYEHCTVLFSDFKGFTTFSTNMDSDTLVAELDHYFRLFDGLCEQYGVEKIKTIGDAYMCAAGIPEPTPTHALDAVLMALGMVEAVDRSNAERRAKGLQEWPVRIGLHTGPVVAGVVGEKKFAYDIWGDTVNLASRMESNGEAGRVNISGPVYAQVMDHVEAQPRGPIQVKGKGQVQMYFVLRLKPQYSADERGLLPNEAFLMSSRATPD